MNTMVSPFKFWDSVVVDAYDDVTFKVVGIAFYPSAIHLQLSYFVNGALTEIWVDSGRCHKVGND